MGELVEGSTLEQIKAIEGWALNAYTESVKKVPNVDVIIENLRKINLQARKLEWGRRRGMDDLQEKITRMKDHFMEQYPKGVFSTERRPSLRNEDQRLMALDNINHILKIEMKQLRMTITQIRATVLTIRDIKKDKGLSNASKRTIRMLSSLAVKAAGEFDSIISSIKTYNY